MNTDKKLQKLWGKVRKYLESGEYDHAEKVCIDMIQLNPLCLNAYYGLTLCKLDQGLYDEAILNGKRGLTIDSSMKELNLLVGNAYYFKGEHSKAIEHWQREIGLNPGEADAYSNISCALCDTGNYQEAVEWSEKALKIDPNSRNAHTNLTRALSKLGLNKEEADSVSQETTGTEEEKLKCTNNIEHCSSEQLLEWVLQNLGAPSDDELHPIDVGLALAYARYGLPDGSRSSPPEWLVRPGWNTIRDALRRTVLPLIGKDEPMLQDVSLGFAKFRAVNAGIYTNKAGAHAVVLNGGIFAGLFSVNERYLQLELAARGEGAEGDINSMISEFHGRVAWHLFEEGEPQLQFTLVFGRRPEVASWIWATSTAQQVFLLMHEYGHITAGAGTHDVIASGVFRHHFIGHDEEFRADQWAATRIAKGIKKLFPEDPSVMTTGVFLMFEYLELLRKTGVYKLEDEYPSPRERFDNIAGILNPSAELVATTALEEKRENFDLLYEAYAVSQRNSSKGK
jgi:tetratricopeptide (TPR) repeat protein